MARRRNADRRATGEIVGAAPVRRALYLRVSTEDQAERGTIRAQLDFLRQRIELDNKGREMQGLPPIIVAGEYLDDGISGATPLGDRPDGGRLLADARSGLFDSVLVYRLDRLGRRLRVLMDAHDSLEDVGATIISASEPFDTSTPFGKAMFQFLGLMAELEKSTIADRMNTGRDTAVRGGKWTNGVIPFGYDTDESGVLVLSERVVPGTGMTEGELAYQVFDRMADRAGESLFGLCSWLNALGVPTESRYPNETIRRGNAEGWKPARVHAMIQRQLYSGTHVFESRLGNITREVPALVSPELQQRAIARMSGNAHIPSHSGRFNVLRALMTCGECGRTYVGVHSRGKAYYRCNGQISGQHRAPGPRCKAKLVPAEEIEGYIKDYVRSVAENPGPEIEEAQKEVRARNGQAVDLEAQRETFARRIRELTGERDRIMTLFKRGMIDLAEAEAQLKSTAETLGAARAELEAIRVQQELAEANESKVISAAAALKVLADRFDEVPLERQREIIAALMPKIVIHTIELPKKVGRASKDYQIEAHVVVGSRPVGAATSTASRRRRTPRSR